MSLKFKEFPIQFDCFIKIRIQDTWVAGSVCKVAGSEVKSGFGVSYILSCISDKSFPLQTQMYLLDY